MNHQNSPLAPNSILGAFEIIEFIAAGGMGSVYKARNRISGDIRAIKIILPTLASDPLFVSRFIREIKAASAVEHPNLVRVFEPAMHGDMMFLPMEMLQGETLSVRLRRQRRLDVQDTLALLLPTASAIAAVHTRGIIHRDLKPTNIFLAIDAAGVITPKVLDFGAARTSDVHDDNTATGIVIGSPPYMSYEQASGIRDIDARVDQYALGVIAYQLLSGARPYENDDTGLALAKILQGKPFPTLRALNLEVPPALEAAILRAMSRDRNERFRDVTEFSEAMRLSVQAHTIVSSMRPLDHAPLPSAQSLPSLMQNPQFVSGPALALPLPPVEAQSGSTMARSSVQIPVPPPAAKSSSMVVLLLAVIAVLGSVLVVIGLHAYRAGTLHGAPTGNAAIADPSAATPHAVDPPPNSAVAAATATPTVTGIQPPITTSATTVSIASAASSATAAATRSHPQPTSTSHSVSTATHAAAPCVPRPGVPCL
ncbi:MAG: protein kinase [Polyangiaceae bacterium]